MINEVLVATTNNKNENIALNAISNRSLLFNIDRKALYAKWDDRLIRIGSTPDNINIIEKNEKLALADIPITQGLVVHHDTSEDWTTHRQIGEVSYEKPILLIFKKNTQDFMGGELLTQGKKETSHYNISFTREGTTPFLSGASSAPFRGKLISCKYHNEEWYGIHFFAQEAMNVYFSGWYTAEAISVGTDEIIDLTELYSGLDDKGDGFNLYMGIQEIFDKLHPLGETYVRYPGMLPPEELYNHYGILSQWELQAQYNGAFFRASGGTAQAFDSETPQEASLPNIKGKINVGSVNDDNKNSKEAKGALKYGDKVGENNVYEDQSWNNSGSYQEILFDASKTLDENGNEVPSLFKGDEIRPENYTIEIYKRVPLDNPPPEQPNIILTYEGIAQMIDNEIIRAKKEESRIDQKLNAEISRSENEDATHSSQINSEVERAKKAEEDLAASLWQNKIYSSFQGMFNAMHPVGEIYVQYPGMEDPNKLYNREHLFNSIWVLQSQYNGAFFRASGGNADPFINPPAEGELSPESYIAQKESLPNIKGIANIGASESSEEKASGAFKYGEYGDFNTVYNNTTDANTVTFQSLLFDASLTLLGDTESLNSAYQDGAEVKPKNFTINIWRRVTDDFPTDLPVKVITIDEIRALIAEEARRAKEAENNIIVRLDEEIARAIARENELNTKIMTSENRAIAKETEIETALDNEKTRALQAEQGLYKKIENIESGDIDISNIHTNQLSTIQPLVITRKESMESATQALKDGEYSGILAKRYNGTADGLLGIDKNGVARVGSVNYNDKHHIISNDHTKALAERVDNPVDEGIGMWNSEKGLFETKQLGIGSSVTVYAESEVEARKLLPTYGNWEVMNIEYRLGDDI